MPVFVLAHRSPKNFAPSPDAPAAWTAWFEQLGPSLMDRGNPVFARASLGNCGADTHLGGYSVISADNLEAALALAQGDPILAAGGGVEVGELTLLNAGRAALA